MNRVPADTVALFGKWDHTNFAKSYGFNISQDALKTMAGFYPKDTYAIPRSKCTESPPKEILNSIFPGIEEVLKEVKEVCKKVPHVDPIHL